MGEVHIVVKRRRKPRGRLEPVAELRIVRGQKPSLVLYEESKPSPEETPAEKGGEDGAEA